MTDPILIARDLRKTFGDNEAVKGISFSVLRGEIFSLLGPNGAGKTTTINMLSCLLAPTSGGAAIAGHAIPGDTLAVRRAIGVVPQEIALYDALSARQNLEFWGRLYDMSGKELTRRIDEVLEQVGLADRAKDKVKTFSGGMKRRINIAAGLLHRPQLLFMDEPTVGIDPQSRRRILDMVRELRDAGMTVLYTTHYMEEAEELSDRVGIIDHGRVLVQGAVPDLLARHANETILIHLTGDPPAGLDRKLERIPGVVEASVANRCVLAVAESPERAIAPLVQALEENGLKVRSLSYGATSLEQVFLAYTGGGGAPQ